MLALVRPDSGGRLDISSTVPVGAGLSSSTAVAVASASRSPAGPARGHRVRPGDRHRRCAQGTARRR
ncbi:MAG: GHMP family kinase ATP-binding protein [Acidimicrobiales bacterium]